MNRSNQHGFEGDLPSVTGGSIDRIESSLDGGTLTIGSRLPKPADNL